MRIALTALTSQGPQDLVVSGDDGAVVGQVAAALRGAAAPGGQRLAPVITLPAGQHGQGQYGPGQRTPGRHQAPLAAAQETLWLDGRPLDPRDRATTALRDGALVAIDPRAAAATSLAEPAGLAEVRVVGGPAAGTVHRLGFGAVMIGASPDCAVRITGIGLPAYAARMVIGPGGPAGQTIVEPLTGRPNTGQPNTGQPDTGQPDGGSPSSGPVPLLDGEPLTGPRPWPHGSLLQIGPHVLALASPEQPDAHLAPIGDGGLAFNRPPRLL
ncbi:MAG TPA: cell division protein FtsK, partial [Streptosporangiaceae bacterium]